MDIKYLILDALEDDNTGFSKTPEIPGRHNVPPQKVVTHDSVFLTLSDVR